MTTREAMRRLCREGFDERAGKGSHRIFRHGDRKVVVADHPGDIPTGTLRQICKQAGREWPLER